MSISQPHNATIRIPCSHEHGVLRQPAETGWDLPRPALCPGSSGGAPPSPESRPSKPGSITAEIAPAPWGRPRPPTGRPFCVQSPTSTETALQCRTLAAESMSEGLQTPAWSGRAATRPAKATQGLAKCTRTASEEHQRSRLPTRKQLVLPLRT
eukprot:scaffold695_cov384-Prasinococcus_capsulatus_cf.AAC.18